VNPDTGRTPSEPVSQHDLFPVMRFSSLIKKAGGSNWQQAPSYRHGVRSEARNPPMGFVQARAEMSAIAALSAAPPPKIVRRLPQFP
jgi:hypothetical protein